MREAPVILAKDGIPFRSILIWLVVTGGGMLAARYGLGSDSLGGNFVVSALVGNAAFAASLG